MHTDAPTSPGRLVELPQPPVRPAAPPRWGGSTAASLIVATASLLMAVSCLLEAPGGFEFPVFTGPRTLVEALPGGAWADWGALFALPAAVVVAGRGKPWTAYAVGVLGVAWALFGGGSLAVGLTSRDAACVGGITQTCVAVLALQQTAALLRRR